MTSIYTAMRIDAFRHNQSAVIISIDKLVEEEKKQAALDSDLEMIYLHSVQMGDTS